jgi:hypothetical protein
MTGPQGPLLKNDGPACRCCGCTENNACISHGMGPTHYRSKVIVPRTYACSWVKVEGATPPLCSACSGTEADMAEAIARGCRMLTLHSTSGIGMAVKIGKAALARRRRRQAENRT